MRFLCRIGFHDYGKWDIKEHGDICSVKTGEVIGKYLVQEQKCRECDKVNIEVERVHR